MSVIIDEDEYLAHYGILRRSGRYPWGSGGPESVSNNPDKRNKTFLDYVSGLKAQGMSETEIARGMGISTTQLRTANSIAKNESRQSDIDFAQRLKDKGMSNTAIAARMGKNESSVRALLDPGAKDRVAVLNTTANMLRDQVKEKEFLDIGLGQANHIGVSQQKLDAAVGVLKEEGYSVEKVKLPQLGTGKETEFKVLMPPGHTQRDLFNNRDKIQQIASFSDDGGRTRYGLVKPLAISPNRVGINWAEDGGSKADGVIYVRHGVDDISLGAARYAQVRIQVGPGHYLKGMAMYKDDLPPGVDLQFNTNKPKSNNKLDALKELKKNEDGTVDLDNPFGAQISHQLVSPDKKRATSAMNIVNEEGDWEKWSDTISSQVLSKQSPSLAKGQLDMTFDRRKAEFDEINSLTNPTVKKRLLADFADATDAAAVHLKAASLPRQKWQVILPVTDLKDTEIYAPSFRTGERVVLIRYPHGGTFEIPELTVNNSHPTAVKLIGKATDAVGIHPDVAARLSGADFDGDSVLVIPNDHGKVKTTSPLQGLKDFDPQASYPAYEGMKRISPHEKQVQMGKVSNLITDMTIAGASHDELARAVRHSMVVIDSEKHNLNYKESEKVNGIKELKAKYQNGPGGGAATLISRAGSEIRIPDRKERTAAKGGPVNLDTGKREFEPTGKTRTTATGVVVPKTIKVDKLSVTEDAHDLSSGTRMERLYADHSNKLKAMANQARLESVKTPKLKYSPTSNKTYSAEVSSLNAKLALALRNKPLERQAQVIGNATVQAKKQANPDMDAATLKKVKAQALEEARTRTGAKPNRIVLDDNEWNAIQAGAISDSKLTKILDNADIDSVRAHAQPRSATLMTSSKTARASSMLAAGYSRADVAKQLGVSLSTLDRSTAS